MDTGLVKYAGFQTYTVLKAVLVSVIPMTMSFSQAVVLPCALSTAAAGLFQATALSMSKPSIDPQDQGASVLIWGGSSSVGSCAIQLARAAGYKVVTTASSRNFQYCKDLGAAAVFDHTSSSAEEQILDALRGDILVGALDSISSDSTIRACAQILSAFEPHQTRRLAITNPMLLSSIPGNVETVHGEPA